jgi:hypothetical protein
METDNCNPRNAAIGLGIRVAEKSKLGKRVLTFSNSPEWIDLDPYDNLIDMCNRLKSDDSWGMNTDFRKAMKLIADACLKKNLTPRDVEDLVLVVFSDMQIDAADKNSSTLHEYVEDLFGKTGMKSKYKVPFKAPHMLYWNLKSSGGFPALSTKNNISMLSGFSPILLNSFCEKGIECLQECSPWHILTEQLQYERYSWCDKLIEDLLIIDKDNELELKDLEADAELVTIEDTLPTDTSNNSKGWFW